MGGGSTAAARGRHTQAGGQCGELLYLEGEGTGSRFAPYPLPCQGRPRRNGPRPSPSMWGNGGVLTSMNHIVSVTQDTHAHTHAHTHTYTHICKSNETDVGQDALENGSNVFLEWWNDLGCSLEPRLSITIIIDPFC